MTPAPTPTPIDPLAILPQVTASTQSYQWVIVIAALLIIGVLVFAFVLRSVKGR